MTDIVFEPLTDSGPIFGYARGQLPRMKGLAVQSTRTNYAFGQLPRMKGGNTTGTTHHLGTASGKLPRLKGIATSHENYAFGQLPRLTGYATDIGVHPNLNLAFGQLPNIQGRARGRIRHRGTAFGQLPRMKGIATDLANRAFGQLPRMLGAAGNIQPQSFLSIIQSAGIVFGSMGGPVIRETITENVGWQISQIADPINVIIERIGLRGVPLSLLDGLTLIGEHMGFADKCAVLYKIIVNESLGLTGDAQPSLLAIELVHEAMGLVLGAGHSVQAFNAITHALAFADAIWVVAKESITEELGFQSAFAQALILREQLVESFGLGVTTDMHAVIGVVVEESLGLGATTATFAEVFETLQDGLEFQVQLQIGDTAYLGWVCNTAAKSFVGYKNYPFNSFATWEQSKPKQYYGMMPDGIYLLSGPKDGDEDIQARIRLGLSNMGTGREKRFPTMYLGYSADGPLLLKVITTDATNGLRSENWYKLTPRASGDMREGRIKIGRALKAVYWDFVIENIDGSQFDLDNVQLQPLVLDRRTRGRDG